VAGNGILLEVVVVVVVAGGGAGGAGGGNKGVGCGGVPPDICTYTVQTMATLFVHLTTPAFFTPGLRHGGVCGR